MFFQILKRGPCPADQLSAIGLGATGICESYGIVVCQGVVSRAATYWTTGVSKIGENVRSDLLGIKV